MTVEPLLFLCHRIPFPPNKGDKIRSYHLLRHLGERHELHVGTFIDDPADRAHLAALQARCASLKVIDIAPTLAKVRSLTGLLRGEALTLPYYRVPALQRWVDSVVQQQQIRRCVVFSSAMAQFVAGHRRLATIVDFCDVDSAKWTQYSAAQGWPSSALYRREGDRLLDYERVVAQGAAAAVFATQAEAALFIRLAPEAALRVHVAENGVDSAYFSPDPLRPSPYPAGEEPIVFTGAMDYWPNADAACWFAAEVLPRVLAERPAARFYVVGMNPGATVAALARQPRIVVTGRVADVRPYMQHARLVVAPLRVARGIQNKVLEAMSMGRPVLASTVCSAGLSGRPGHEFETADGADEFVRRCVAMLTDRRYEALGRRARECIVQQRDWSRNLALFDRLLADGIDRQAPMPSAQRKVEHAR